MKTKETTLRVVQLIRGVSEATAMIGSNGYFAKRILSYDYKFLQELDEKLDDIKDEGGGSVSGTHVDVLDR